jgi:small-conductance mechanosensitive channel
VRPERRTRLGGLAALAVLGVARGASAATDPDLGQIVTFVRWSGVLVSIGVIVGTAILLRFLGRLADQLGARFGHRRLLIHKVWSFARFFLYLTAGGVVVSLSFQFNQTVLALVGGTLAVAIGFAMRDLVAAMIAGITIMLDRPFQVGDRVEYGGEYGDIVAIGLRSVRMVTLDDNVVTIPNNKVLTDVTSCGNYGALDMQVSVHFHIGTDQDFDAALEIIREALTTSRFAFLEKPVVVLMEQVLDGSVAALHLRGKAYVLDTKYEKAFVTDVTQSVLRAFREQGIQPPAVLHRTAVREPSA